MVLRRRSSTSYRYTLAFFEADFNRATADAPRDDMESSACGAALDGHQKSDVADVSLQSVNLILVSIWVKGVFAQRIDV